VATELPQALFSRLDTEADTEFYALPRFVTHVDDATIAALTQYLDEVLNEDCRVVDLMSSWISHLPDTPMREVVCVGMNEQELAANPRADTWHIHDLNDRPKMALEQERYDWVIISFSIQYLTSPVAVLADVARVLAPGGHVLIALSHRCFPTKAIRAFNILNPTERIEFVRSCIDSTDAFLPATFVDRSPRDADPLWLIQAQKS
jgi:SAM-dependent methyltransferase